jgi:hypothetical protein
MEAPERYRSGGEQKVTRLGNEAGRRSITARRQRHADKYPLSPTRSNLNVHRNPRDTG